MEKVQPQVALVAATELNLDGLKTYLEDVGAENFAREFLDGDYYKDVRERGCEGLSLIGGKLCYKAFEPGLNPNVTKVRDDPLEYLDNINSTGHGSVLEHASVTFIFWNISRVFTHELVRHRAGCAMSQESLRYVRLTDLKAWYPSCITDNPEAADYFDQTIRELETKQATLAAMFAIEDMKNFSQKKTLTSAFRRIAPIGLSTAIMFTMNIRAARHIIQMRTATAAEEEIRGVFHKVAETLVSKYPVLFSDFERSNGPNGIPVWRSKYAAMPYDGERIKQLEKELETTKKQLDNFKNDF